MALIYCRWFSNGMINRLGLVDTAAAILNAKYNCVTNGGQIRSNANFIVYSNYKINGPESRAKNELISCCLKIPTQKLNNSFSFRSLNKKNNKCNACKLANCFHCKLPIMECYSGCFKFCTPQKKPHSNRTRLTIDWHTLLIWLNEHGEESPITSENVNSVIGIVIEMERRRVGQMFNSGL